MRPSYRSDPRVRLKKIIRILPDGKNSTDAIGIRLESQSTGRLFQAVLVVVGSAIGSLLRYYVGLGPMRVLL